ncbi:hypothetical protein CEK26_000075 [Fusarium fujikuroi]|uniref:Uncharacterized protein n=1 Tax=Fusarium fujikuroi TaxID=5127 RepID=A0A2H3RH71_FUSFU|nr:uncharacterized protein Y057_6958 [Fusarium fujikuroi]QGI57949.1 hypothetical protein CEK27_000074 [Fusarium fujikuroi]QGI88860.1 hypothetical protein CEK26_000075 [Fusarium fujikuroi]SCN74649.1 uncharacterized protein FFC1_02133 [Fusarium fujikuroi]SCV54072.1 uncharacterized protein FFFS_11077 [Fusarium fujikuroi]
MLICIPFLVPNEDIFLDRFLIDLKDNGFSTQAASLNGVILQGGKLSQRPDTPIPISRNQKNRSGLSSEGLRLPPSVSSNQFLKDEEKQSPQFPSRSSTPSKRRRTAGLSDDLYDLDEDGDNSPNEIVKRFACPYFRKNPERHLECINLKMVRISDVKQHLKRRHTARYHCPICCEGFSSLNLQGNHILQQTCVQGSGANWDSVSPASQKALQARFGKTLSPEAQWYGIWTILFGERRPMPNPHLDGVVKEVIGILRGIWLDEGRRLISEFVEAKDQPTSYNDQLYQLLAGVLDEVEARFEQESSEKISSKTSVVSEPSPEESAGVQLDTVSRYITEGPDSQSLVAPYDTTSLFFDFSAAPSEVSEVSYQASEFGFSGTQLLQTRYSYPDNPVSDFNLWDCNQQQPIPMDGAML